MNSIELALSRLDELSRDNNALRSENRMLRHTMTSRQREESLTAGERRDFENALAASDRLRRELAEYKLALNAVMAGCLEPYRRPGPVLMGEPFVMRVGEVA